MHSLGLESQDLSEISSQVEVSQNVLWPWVPWSLREAGKWGGEWPSAKAQL